MPADGSLRWRARRYLWYNSLKSAPCTDCRQRFPPECMDFDHVRGRKLFAVGIGMMSKGKKLLEREIKKCDLVCSNCHRIRTKARSGKRQRSVKDFALRKRGPKPKRRLNGR